MNDDFGISVTLELMLTQETILQFFEIIDLSIESDPNGSVFIRHRLGSARTEIDDRESLMCKPNISQIARMIHMNPALIRPAMSNNLTHSNECCRITCSCKSCYSTHSELILAFNPPFPLQ